MEVIYPRSAAVDVHEAFVMVCRRLLQADGQVDKVVRRYSTMTADLLALADWLADAGVTHVAMESTGVFWKPVWNLLESRFTLVLVNPRDVKQVPGRKTDVADAAWLAQLLQYGLLKGSHVPPPPIRVLRDLTRHRTTLIHDKTRVVNRIHKVLEDANIKLTAVASDIMGVSGRAMLAARAWRHRSAAARGAGPAAAAPEAPAIGAGAARARPAPSPALVAVVARAGQFSGTGNHGDRGGH